MTSRNDTMRKPKGGRTFDQPRAAKGPRRLSPETEAQIREMVASTKFANPTIRVLLAEVDALRGERSAIKAELQGVERRLAEIEAMHRFVLKLYPDAAKAACEAGIQLEPTA